MDWLPDLLLLSAHGGNWDQYLQAVHEQFRNDFVVTRPTLDGEHVGVRRTPLVDGREQSFWHIVSEGSVEDDRLPSMERCERIGWPRSMIAHAATDDVRYWSKDRRRIVVALADFSYLAILTQANGYKLMMTAYPVERTHRRNKLEKEWKRYS